MKFLSYFSIFYSPSVMPCTVQFKQTTEVEHIGTVTVTVTDDEGKYLFTHVEDRLYTSDQKDKTDFKKKIKDLTDAFLEKKNKEKQKADSISTLLNS